MQPQQGTVTLCTEQTISRHRLLLSTHYVTMRMDDFIELILGNKHMVNRKGGRSLLVPLSCT